MAWNIDLVLMLRSLIGDLDKSKYKLKKLAGFEVEIWAGASIAKIKTNNHHSCLQC